MRSAWGCRGERSHVCSKVSPNTQQWLARFSPAWDAVAIGSSRLAWVPSRRHAVFVGLLFSLGLLSLTRVSEFLYFQF